MSDYRPGEIVDITIKGARIARTGQDDIGRAFIEYTHGEYNALATADTDGQDVTIARVAPAEWPPRVGDLWRDKHTALWMCVDDTDRGPDGFVESTLGMVCAHGGLGSTPEDLLAEVGGSLTLVHREEASDA